MTPVDAFLNYLDSHPLGVDEIRNPEELPCPHDEILSSFKNQLKADPQNKHSLIQCALMLGHFHEGVPEDVSPIERIDLIHFEAERVRAQLLGLKEYASSHLLRYDVYDEESFKRSQ